MISRREPEDVFTPTAVATRDMFERRNEVDRLGNPGLQDRLVEAFRQKGAQMRVFGDTGVGKTSLVAFAAEEASRSILTVECRSSYDYADLLEQAIRSIRGVRLTSYEKTREMAAGIEGGGGWKWLATIKGNMSVKNGKRRNFEVVDKGPLELLLELMREQDYSVLVLDNFHNVKDPATRNEVAQTIEALADRAGQTGDVKMVIIGIAEDASTLLTPSESVRRRTVDIGVPRMPDDEIRSILRNGFKLLRLELGSGLEDYLIYYCDGFPFFTHMIGLNIARAVRRDGARRIVQKHLAAGLLRTVNEVDDSYATRVRMAIERGGEVQPKRRILGLLAESPSRTWTCKDVKDLWRQRYATDTKKLQFIDVAMGSLVKEEKGRVLARDETSTPYRYRFRDPHFRTYLRLSEFGENGAGRHNLLADPERQAPIASARRRNDSA